MVAARSGAKKVSSKTPASRRGTRSRRGRSGAKNASRTVAVKAKDVVNYFIALTEEGGGGILPTPSRLADLVYIAHGWNLAINNRPLIEDRIVAQRSGPVISGLHENIGKGRFVTGSGNGERWRKGIEKFLESQEKNHKDMEVAKVVFDKYRSWRPSHLSEMTDGPGTPWDIVWNQWRERDPDSAVISDELIKGHFVSLGRRISRAAERA